MSASPTHRVGHGRGLRNLVRFALIGLAGCSGAPDPAGEAAGASGSPDVFLAFADDFRGYHSWPSYDATDGAELVGIHDGSTVIEYINQPPASGSDEFAIGTLIVKEATGGTIPHELFAMAKRGGGYNRGAPGWEWFELENLDDGQDSVKQIWRGVGPPIGEMYGGDPNAGCNQCHTECGNDAVCARALSLAAF